MSTATHVRQWILCVLVCTALPASALIQYRGVNLAGAEFGTNNLPGTYGYDYTYPVADEVDYFLSKNMNTMRIPFRWERLQQTLMLPFDSVEFDRLDAIVRYATSQGSHVILDPHNYARYHGDVIGSLEVPNAAFSDLWSRLADVYKDDPLVIFGLMTEPHDMPTEQWVSAANAAIQAIRLTGAQNLILVPGNGWTAASSWTASWYGTSNATAMHDIYDSADNFAFEVHLYLDDDSSGFTPEIMYPTVGSDRLYGFTQWIAQYGYRGFLTEFAVAEETIGDDPSQIGDEALAHILNALEADSDLWIGWSWWAAGPWWQDYMFTIEPDNLGFPDETDQPQMAELEPYLLPEPTQGLLVGAFALSLLRRRRRASQCAG